MDKAPDAFRTIREVAEWLETPAHVLRFWESRFSQIKPVKRAGGRRYYRPDDMALLGGIKYLLHDQGMTIRGVQKILADQGVRHVAGLSGATPGVTSDGAINHLASEKASATTVRPGGQRGHLPPKRQDIPVAQAPEPGSAAPGTSPTGKSGLDIGALVKADPAQAAQPEFSFTPQPSETGARTRTKGSPESPSGSSDQETSAPEAAAASREARSLPAASDSAHPSAPDAATKVEADGKAKHDAPASEPDASEPKVAARTAAIATPVATPPADQPPASPIGDMTARTLITRRLRAGGQITPGDLSKVRALASRLAALQARMTGLRPGGPSHP